MVVYGGEGEIKVIPTCPSTEQGGLMDNSSSDLQRRRICEEGARGDVNLELYLLGEADRTLEAGWQVGECSTRPDADRGFPDLWIVLVAADLADITVHRHTREYLYTSRHTNLSI
jgi:hypothetical protein